MGLESLATLAVDIVVNLRRARAGIFAIQKDMQRTTVIAGKMHNAIAGTNIIGGLRKGAPPRQFTIRDIFALDIRAGHALLSKEMQLLAKRDALIKARTGRGIPLLIQTMQGRALFDKQVNMEELFKVNPALAHRINTLGVPTSTNLSKAAKAALRFQTILTGIGIAFTGFLVGEQLIRTGIHIVVELTSAYAELEKQLIEVQKVARFEDFNKFQKDFLQQAITLRAPFETFSAIYASAARTGVSGERLTELAKEATKFSQVASDISEREAAEGVAALLDNFNLLHDKNFQIQELTANLSALADASILTPGEILKSSARLSGFAQTVGMTYQELNSLVTLLLKARPSSTVARTTVTRAFTALRDDPLKIQAALKLSNEEMDKLVETLDELGETDPITALTALIAALDRLTPQEQIAALNKLGLASSQVKQAMAILEVKVRDLPGLLELSGNAIKNQIDFNNKWAESTGTVVSRIDELNNRWTTFKATLARSESILDFATGALITLDRAAGGSGPEVKPKTLGETKLEVIQNLTEVESEIFRLKASIERRGSILHIAGRMAFAPFMGPIPLAQSAYSGLKEKGRLADLERQRDLLNEQLKLFRKKEEDDLAKRTAATKVDIEKDLALGIGTGGIGIPPEAKPRLTIAQQHELAALDKLKELEKQFKLTEEDPEIKRLLALKEKALDLPAIGAADEAVYAFTKAIDASIEAIDLEKKKRIENAAAEKLFKELGDFGEIIDIFTKFRDLELAASDLGLIGGPMGAIADLRELEIKRLISPEEIKEPVFKDLTQSWKDAVTTIEEEKDERDKKMLEIALALLPKLSDMGINLALIKNDMEKLAAKKGFVIGP